MSDQELRLRQWMQAYGHEKQPAFISDLTAVCDQLASVTAERDRLRTHATELSDAIHVYVAEVNRSDVATFRHIADAWQKLRMLLTTDTDAEAKP